MNKEYRLGEIVENKVILTKTHYSLALQVKFHLSEPYIIEGKETTDIWVYFSGKFPDRIDTLLESINLPNIEDFPSKEIIGKTCYLGIDSVKYLDTFYPKVTEFSRIDPTVDNFLDDLEELYRRYGLCLAHEDHQGAFIIEKLSEDRLRWVRNATRNVKD